LAARAGVFYAAVGGVINTKRRHISKNHATNLQIVVRLEDQARVIGEQAGLQSIAGGVDGGQGLREIVISFHGFYRSKNLFAVYAHVRGRASEDGGLEQCTITLASAQ